MDGEPGSAGYSMVQECCDYYRVERRPDSGVRIEIIVPARFALLWMAKLSDLRATDAEIAEYESGQME